MNKTIVRLVGVILVVCCMCISVSAAVIVPVTPMWDTVDRVSCRISFDGTAGKVVCDITAVSGTESIEGTLTLYEDGIEIDSWEIDVSTSYVTILDSFTGIKGCTYELVLDVDVVTDGVTEPIEVTTTKVCN